MKEMIFTIVILPYQQEILCELYMITPIQIIQ